MKRKLCIFAEILVFLLIFGLIGKPGNGNSFVPELHGKAVDIYFNDILVTDWGDAIPFIDQNGRTLIPLRFYSEKIGCSVDWSQKDKKITITYIQKDYYGNSVSKKVITLWVNNRKTYVYDSVTGETKAIWLDTIPWQEPKYPWRVYIPLRFVSSCLGDMVTWFPQGATLKLFPDITIDKDTVMLAHFLPEIPEDYLIVPGERFGKYSLRMPLEQFQQLVHFKKHIYCGSLDGRNGIYAYDFSIGRQTGGIWFIKNVGILTLSFVGSVSFDSQYSVEGYPIKVGQWINIDKFLTDYLPDRIRQHTIMRGGKDVNCYLVDYNTGFSFTAFEDYDKFQNRGYFVEFMGIFLSEQFSLVYSLIRDEGEG